MLYFDKIAVSEGTDLIVFSFKQISAKDVMIY